MARGNVPNLGHPGCQRASAAGADPGIDPGSDQSGADAGLDSNGNPLTFAGSPRAAAAFLDLIVAGDYAAAFDSLTDGLRLHYGDADEFLANLFGVIGSPGSISEVSSWQISETHAGPEQDEIHFFVDTDLGYTNLTVAVTGEGRQLKVCLFESPDAIQVTGAASRLP